MNGLSLSLLRQFDDELLEQFEALRHQRVDKPVFLIEHALDDARLSEMRQIVGAHARLAGLAPERWIGASLPLAVAVTETGYRYRGTGTEFWSRFEDDVGAEITHAERSGIRRVFEGLSRRLNAASPNDSDWARAFNIIAWPIRNALAPVEIHRPLAEALGRLAASGGHSLPDGDFQRRLLAIADGLWSRRLSDWLRDSNLAVGLCRNLLSGEDAPTWIEPRAAARIARDIRADAECRQALQQARRIFRSVASAALPRLSQASWTLSLRITEDGPAIKHVLLQGPFATPRLREAVLADLGRSAALVVKGSDQKPVLLEQFLQGETVELLKPEAAWRPDLLSLAQVNPAGASQDLLKQLTPPPPVLFRWNESGGLLSALKKGAIVGGDDLLLVLTPSDNDNVAVPGRALEIIAPDGLIAWIARAEACRLLLNEAGVRIAADRLLDFTSTARLQIDGNRILSAGVAPLFLRARVNGLEVRLQEAGSLPANLSEGDVLLVPASTRAVALEVLAGSRSEHWQIEPLAEVRSAAFDCRVSPAKPTINDFLSGELVVFLSSPIPLERVRVEMSVHRNGECLAAVSTTVPVLPGRVDCLASDFQPLREAAFDASHGSPHDRWSLGLDVKGLHRFDYPLEVQRSTWKNRVGTLEWMDEGGRTAGPGLTAPAFAPVPVEASPATETFSDDDIRLWLPDTSDTVALLAGTLTGEAQLFRQAKQPEIGLIGRAIQTSRGGEGVISLSQAFIAWRSASTQDMLADRRRGNVVRCLEMALTAAFCGEDWVEAEREAGRSAVDFAGLLAHEALNRSLAEGTDFPCIEDSDRSILSGLLAARFEKALSTEHTPSWMPCDDTAGKLDEAITEAYSDLSKFRESQGKTPLAEIDAYNDIEAWKRASEAAQRRFNLSPFRRLTLPQWRWQGLQATRYEGLSDDDLVTLLTRFHLDISRAAGREWIGSSAIRSGLMLWLSPADLLDTLDWHEHMARLLSDRHTSRAIRYVALRSRSMKHLRSPVSFADIT